MRAMLRRVEDDVIRAFGKALPYFNWAFFIVGVLGAGATAVGLLSTFSTALWAKITTILLWLLFAREGYEGLVEQQEDEDES